jgi:hypothetical protein
MVHAIVGVMPLGFAFPVAHGYCVPLRITGADLQPGPGPAMYVSEIASVRFGSRECVSFCISAARAEPLGCGEKLVEPHACVVVTDGPLHRVVLDGESPASLRSGRVVPERGIDAIAQRDRHSIRPPRHEMKI